LKAGKISVSINLKTRRIIMISSIGSYNTSQYMSLTSFNTEMTDEQKTTLQDILSKYDSSTITEDGMKSLMDEIKSAGITPSKDLKDTVEAAGFNMKPPAGGPPPMGGGAPPSGMSGMSSTSSTSSTDETDETDSSSYLEELMNNLMEQLQSGKTTETEVTNVIKSLQEAGMLSQGMFVDTKA
jgi:hypothetical protein